VNNLILASAIPPVWTQVLFFPFKKKILTSSLQDSGIGFTFKTNQYIQVPAFIPPADDSAVTLSLGFSFYLRLDQAPATDGLVFTYWCMSVSNLSFIEILKFSACTFKGDV